MSTLNSNSSTPIPDIDRVQEMFGPIQDTNAVKVLVHACDVLEGVEVNGHGRDIGRDLVHERAEQALAVVCSRLEGKGPDVCMTAIQAVNDWRTQKMENVFRIPYGRAAQTN